MNLQRKTTRRLAILWALGIFAACSIPSSGLPHGQALGLDKLAHLLMFAGFGALWMLATRGPLLRRGAGVMGAGVLFAAATEGWQYLMPLGRAAEWLDVGADLVGLILALACYGCYHHFTTSAPNAERV